MIKKMLLKIRLWLLSILFTNDEKYLLARAIEDRVYDLETIKLFERWADKEEVQEDIDCYSNLKVLFSVKENYNL